MIKAEGRCRRMAATNGASEAIGMASARQLAAIPDIVVPTIVHLQRNLSENRVLTPVS
jgi:hypothetical protein